MNNSKGLQIYTIQPCRHLIQVPTTNLNKVRRYAKYVVNRWSIQSFHILREGETSEIKLPEQATRFEQEHREKYLCNQRHVTTLTTIWPVVVNTHKGHGRPAMAQEDMRHNNCSVAVANWNFHPMQWMTLNIEATVVAMRPTVDQLVPWWVIFSESDCAIAEFY